MIPFGEIVERLKFHEGFVDHKYFCKAGYTTIGIGRNLDTNPLTKDEKEYIKDINKITLKEAEYLLKNDINLCIMQLKANLLFYKGLDDERQYALLDMCFQHGIKGFLKYKKMLYAMSIGDYQGAEKECLDSNYARQCPERAKRIANLIKNGYWEK